jgi:twitching motility protein PilU
VDEARAARYMYDLVELLLSRKGSDIFVTAGSPPAIKVDDQIHRVGGEKLTPLKADVLVRSVMNDRQLRVFDRQREVNFALNYPNIARFRVSAFSQRGSAGMVLRLINSRIPTMEELNLPPILKSIAMAKRGLVLFLGGTGCGKSTSLAAMVDYRNSNAYEHIITIEDPIEFLHRHKKCLVNQREIGLDSESYSVALKNALRQAPDVMMIGEIRDRETMEHAIAFVETGHLCLSTLHANNSDQAFDRILNFFPGEQRSQVLMALSFNLRAFISQRLIKRIDAEGMVPAMEILLNTPLMADLVREGKLAEIKPLMARSSEQGIKTFDQCLFELYEAGMISYDSALQFADSRNNVRLNIKLESKRPQPRGEDEEISLKADPDDRASSSRFRHS